MVSFKNFSAFSPVNRSLRLSLLSLNAFKSNGIISDMPPVAVAAAMGMAVEAVTFNARIQLMDFLRLVKAVFRSSILSPTFAQNLSSFSNASTMPWIKAIFASSKLSNDHPSKYTTTVLSSFFKSSSNILRMLDFPEPQSPYNPTVIGRFLSFVTTLFSNSA